MTKRNRGVLVDGLPDVYVLGSELHIYEGGQAVIVADTPNMRRELGLRNRDGFGLTGYSGNVEFTTKRGDEERLKGPNAD